MTNLFFHVILLTISLCFHKLVFIRSIVVLYSFFVIETSIQDLYEKLNWQDLKPSQFSILANQWIIHIDTLQDNYLSSFSFISKQMQHLQWVQLWLRLFNKWFRLRNLWSITIRRCFWDLRNHLSKDSSCYLIIRYGKSKGSSSSVFLFD